MTMSPIRNDDPENPSLPSQRSTSQSGDSPSPQAARVRDGSDAALWHLGESPRELGFARFQHALICAAEAFYRNAGRNLSLLMNDQNLNGQDSVLLQVIHTVDRPKTIADLQQFTNRTDIANIQYSVRKLERAGLLQKVESDGRGAAYSLTDQGKRIVDAYVEARRALLNSFPETDEDLLGRLENAKSLLVILSGLYDHDTREQLTRSSMLG